MNALPEYSLSTLDVIHCTDALSLLRGMVAGSVNCIVTSPPYYGLRDYGVEGQIGLEDTPQAFVARLVAVFREARRVLRDDGVLWVNMGDSYNSAAQFNNGRSSTTLTQQGKIYREMVDDQKWPGHRALIPGLKPKDLIGVPWRLAFALQDDGWYLRSDCIWHKPNPMPESVTDRPTKAHEYMFLLSKSERYWYDADAVREPHTDKTIHIDKGTRGNQAYGIASGLNDHPQRDSNGGLGKHEAGRNKRTVWTVATHPLSDAHFATFPPKLIEPCILAGCPKQVCAECGMPYVRVVDVERSNYKVFDHPQRTGGAVSGGVGKNFPDTTRIDKGFKSQCDCNGATRPGITLDMFGGAGTTALVAKQHGRHYILSELNPAYVQIARRRLMTKIDRMNADTQTATYDDLPLFAEAGS